MKLLNKSTLYFILSLLPVFVISWFIIYTLISQSVHQNTDESLLAQKKIIIDKFIASDSAASDLFNDADDDVAIVALPHSVPLQTSFSDTLAFDSTEMEMVPFRKLKSTFTKDGHFYEIMVTRSNIKSDELAESISLGLISMFGLILISVVIINRIISGRLLKPFYQTLEQLNRISFADAELNPFQVTHTQEFDQLNKALNSMTRKMFVDYINQKQFTENASHELQTPLAVIKSRIDVLIQDKHLSSESMDQIQEIEKSVNKLSHLNKSLLLLSKIENRQFEDSAPIELQNLLDDVISDFDDSLTSKNIVVQREYKASPVLSMNPLLADILFSNLIQNASRYNLMNGYIKIELTEDHISIINPGQPFEKNEERIYDRFTKFNASVESLGLGLSIVKQICLYYNFPIQYKYVEGDHMFTIIFAT